MRQIVTAPVSVQSQFQYTDLGSFFNPFFKPSRSQGFHWVQRHAMIRADNLLHIRDNPLTPLTFHMSSVDCQQDIFHSADEVRCTRTKAPG